MALVVLVQCDIIITRLANSFWTQSGFANRIPNRDLTERWSPRLSAAILSALVVHVRARYDRSVAPYIMFVRQALVRWPINVQIWRRVRVRHSALRVLAP